MIYQLTTHSVLMDFIKTTFANALTIELNYRCQYDHLFRGAAFIYLLFWLAIKKCDPNPNQAKCSCHLGPDVGALMPVLNKMYPTNINVSILCCSCQSSRSVLNYVCQGLVPNEQQTCVYPSDQGRHSIFASFLQKRLFVHFIVQNQ